ncbi:MAG: FtsX-like permease family protein [Saprospiraceae bacterium]
MSSIICGIAALVAINSFNHNLVKDVNEQSKSLLGADVVISGNRPVVESLQGMMDSLVGEKSSEVELFSMSFIPKSEETQFVRLKALEGGFPYYGKLSTVPDEAGTQFKTSKTALVEESMMLQYELSVGDSIKLGQATFLIGGTLKNVFGSLGAGASFAPTIYIAKKYLDETELVQPGSMVDYGYYYKVAEDFDTDTWKKKRNERFRNESFRITTMTDQRENLNEAFANLNSFLNLVALVALLLGCIGVASSVMIYVREKMPSIAVFRCLGMKGNHAFLIYFIQIVVLGCIGVVIGAALGSAIQVYLPVVLKDFLPYEVVMDISWRAISQGLGIGLIVSILFALIPLLSIRNVSPLRTLRASFEDGVNKRDFLKWAAYGGIVISIFGFLYSLTGNIKDSTVFTIGLLAAFGILYGVASFVMWAVKKFLPRHWSFIFRQGLSNLYRPNNQTKTLLTSIGLGTVVLATLFIIQGLLLKNVASMDAGNQPNMILYGIEKEQSAQLAEITESHSLPVIAQVPIVTMRLEGWKGRSKADWLTDTARTASRWAINREARVSYRDTLTESEKLVEGSFIGNVEKGDSVFISLAQMYKEALDVELGDELIWNVQGARIKTYVGSIREIEFNSMSTRFFVLFPNGVLEKAPQFEVLVTKSPDVHATASYRSEVVKTFPNISVIDLGSILAALNDILNKVSYIIKFMAGFSILTGFLVLLSSLILSKFQRVKESVLLRTLGASRKQIFTINVVEYALLGSLSSLTGIALALIASFLLAKYMFEIDYSILWSPIILMFVIVTSLTIFIGMLNSREVLNKSPLEVLRKEVG